MVKIELGKLEIGLYKLLNDSYQEMDIPYKVQVYLSGMMVRALNQEYAADLNQFIVPNMKELEKKILDIELDGTESLKKYISEMRKYKVGKYNGEYHTMNPILQNQNMNDTTFPHTCFRYAKLFAKRLEKKEESEIFKYFVDEFDDYVRVLQRYTHIINSGKLKLTRDDYKGFKEFLIESYKKGEEKKDKKIIKAPEIKEDDIDDQFI